MDVSNKKKPKYKEEKAHRVLLDEDTEYIAVIMENSSTGFEVGVEAGDVLPLPKGGKVGLEREKRKRVLATYIRDPNYGLLPEKVWNEQKRVEVAGTLSPHVNTAFTAEQVTVTSSLRPPVQISCPKCGGIISVGSQYCGVCGALLKP